MSMYDDEAVQASGLKIPPHSIEAEQVVLSCILRDEKVIYDVADLKPTDFYKSDHRVIFAAMLEMLERGKEIDVITVIEHLPESERDAYSGVIFALSAEVGHNFRAYADIIKNRSRRRDLISASHALAAQAFTEEDPSGALSNLFNVVEQETTNDLITLDEAIVEAVEYTDQVSQGVIQGVPTGIGRFDSVYGGLHDSHLYIIGGRPAMGKTAVAGNIMHQALMAGNKVGFLSLEMKGRDISHRLISLAGQVSSQKLRNGKLDNIDAQGMANGVAALNNLPLIIYQGSNVNITEIIQISMQMKHRNKIDLLVIDYLQLIKGTGNNRAEEINDVSRSLKSIAKRLDIPVVALAQVNRDVEKRSNKRPVMADLKDSGGIEQDADLVALLYRDGYYYEDKEDKTLEFIVDKNRHGPVGTVYCGWDSDLMLLKQPEDQS